MSIHVSHVPAQASVVGGCSSCSSRGQVWTVQIGNNSLRVCFECRGELIRQLGAKSKAKEVVNITLDWHNTLTDPSLKLLTLVANTQEAEWRDTFPTVEAGQWFFRGARFISSMAYTDPCCPYEMKDNTGLTWL